MQGSQAIAALMTKNLNETLLAYSRNITQLRAVCGGDDERFVKARERAERLYREYGATLDQAFQKVIREQRDAGK